jgi:hypothetical protein
MGDVQFEENQEYTKFEARTVMNQSPTEPFYVRLLIRIGLAKDESGAKYILIGFTIICIIVSIIILYFTFKPQIFKGPINSEESRGPSESSINSRVGGK